MNLVKLILCGVLCTAAVLIIGCSPMDAAPASPPPKYPPRTMTEEARLREERLGLDPNEYLIQWLMRRKAY